MSTTAVTELARRFTCAVAGLNPDRVAHAVLHDALANLVENVKADAPAVAHAVGKKRAQRGGTTPLPLAYFTANEEPAFLTGASGDSGAGAEDSFASTANDTVARFGLAENLVGGAKKRFSLPRDIIKALRGVPGARETLVDALEFFAGEVGAAGAVTKTTVRRSALKKVISRR